jgi:hypothetical protein
MAMTFFMLSLSFLILVLDFNQKAAEKRHHRHRFTVFISMSALLFYKTKKPYPKYGTRLASCGTTQIDNAPRHYPLIIPYLHTGRVGNGSGSRRLFCEDAFGRPHKSIRPASIYRTSTCRGSL